MNPAFLEQPDIPVQFIKRNSQGVSLYLKREDLLHPQVSGNKFRKLKYNFQEAISRGEESILTFGGAYSNHIAATASAGKLFGLKTIGVIRGEELGKDLDKTLKGNPTLRYAASCGMHLTFVSRSEYREKHTVLMMERLHEKFGSFFAVPEGGTNDLAVQGCEEILTEKDKGYDVICCAVGTGGTLSGLINASSKDQTLLGFPALKGDFLSSEVKRFSRRNNWKIIPDYHFGGYAKVTPELIEFINRFRADYDIPLDPVYTGKMIFGLFDLMEKETFLENTRILAVHTGGLQGISGMNKVLRNKGLPQINN